MGCHVSRRWRSNPAAVKTSITCGVEMARLRANGPLSFQPGATPQEQWPSDFAKRQRCDSARGTQTGGWSWWPWGAGQGGSGFQPSVNFPVCNSPRRAAHNAAPLALKSGGGEFFDRLHRRDGAVEGQRPVIIPAWGVAPVTIVEMARSAPRGRNMPAQGNALGSIVKTPQALKGRDNGCVAPSGLDEIIT